MAQQRETRDHGEQERHVEPADAGEDARYVEQEEDTDRDAEEGVPPSRRTVAVPVVVIVSVMPAGPGGVIVLVIAVVGPGMVEEALTHAGSSRTADPRS